MVQRRVIQPVEVLYLCHMKKWVDTAPPNRHKGFLDGEPVINSQISRLVYVLRLIAAGNTDVYPTLALHTRREVDNESYISRNSTWMESPQALGDGWFYEGGMKFDQKENLINALSNVRLTPKSKYRHSPAFTEALARFVNNEPFDQFFPTPMDETAITALIEEYEDKHRDGE